MRPPSEQQWEAFYAQVRRKTGLNLHEYKADQLRRRLLNLFRPTGTSSLDELWAYAQQQENGTKWLFDKIAINVTELFRNPEKWEEMERHILPQLVTAGRPLKTWSAGCSIGAEAHSLAILLAEKFPGNHTILGTDIDFSALAEAKAGEFSAADMKATPTPYKSKYFDAKDGSYTAKPSIRKYLQFRHGNLLADQFDQGFDLIMCRNVVIYFTDEAKENLYQKFRNALRPGGILWVGGTERIHSFRELGFESTYPFFYKKTINVENKWRNAS